MSASYILYAKKRNVRPQLHYAAMEGFVYSAACLAFSNSHPPPNKPNQRITPNQRPSLQGGLIHTEH